MGFGVAGTEFSVAPNVNVSVPLAVDAPSNPRQPGPVGEMVSRPLNFDLPSGKTRFAFVLLLQAPSVPPTWMSCGTVDGLLLRAGLNLITPFVIVWHTTSSFA